ncbi:MAG TPA: hypothetical protein VE870_12460, partial [Bacteroidales bacterium]|nr:hypothetical protein [Bacteroidales bacterium]
DIAVFLSQYSVDRPETREERQERYLRGAWDGVMTVPPGKHGYHAKYRGQIRNVVFNNISVNGYLPFSVINGFDKEHQVKNVVINGIKVCGKDVKNEDELKLHTEFADGVVVK